MPGEPRSTSRRDSLLGIEHGMIAHDVARWIIGGRRAGVIGRLVDGSAAGGADEALVAN